MKPLPNALRDAFERFWLAVPKRPADRPGKAREEFARLVKAGVPAEGLVQAAEAYALDVARRRVDPQYIPLTGKWLREGGHEAYPPAPAPAEPTVDTSVSQDPLYTRLDAAGLTDASYRAWISACALTVQGATLIVGAPTRFHAETVRERFHGVLLKAFSVRKAEYRWPKGGAG